MALFFESLQQFQRSGGLKQTTITPKQLLPAIVSHMQRGDRKFSLYVNGRMPKPLSDLLQDAFDVSHLQLPFHTQHCGRQHSKYVSVTKNRIKVDFTLNYHMTRPQHQWVTEEIKQILQQLITKDMTTLEKIVAVHDYIVRNHQYEMNTTGSPFTVYTFMHEKQGVCMAYALLFEKMMESLDIPCYYVVGKADGESDLGHAWNMVELDGEWYHIDATWNDLGSKLPNHEIRYRYFLRSDAFMKRDHHWNPEHYPQCLSETYKGLSNVYDVTFSNGKLYFPHPKTAHLIEMDLATRRTNTLLEEKVQFCTMQEGQLYFSHYGKKGYLYTYLPASKTFSCVEERQVTSVKKTLHQLVIQFKDGDPMTLDSQIKPIEVEEVEAEEVQLTGFAMSLFGSYKGKPQPVRFVSEDGIEILIEEPFKQLSIDFLCFEQLTVSITANKKTLHAKIPVKVKIPATLVEGKVNHIQTTTENGFVLFEMIQDI